MRKNVQVIGNFKQTFHIFLKGKHKLFILMPANKTGKTSSFFIQQELVITALFPAPITDFQRLSLLFQKKRRILRLYSKNYGYISFAELEAARRIIKRISKKTLKKRLFIPSFPFLYLTKKPSEVRMGKGKGTKIRDRVCPIRPGKVIIELKQISKRLGIFALTLARKKLSIFTAIVRHPHINRHRYIKSYRNYLIN